MRWRPILDLPTRRTVLTALLACLLPMLASAAPSLGRYDLMAYGRWLQESDALRASTTLYPSGDRPGGADGLHLTERRILAAQALEHRRESIERAWDRGEFEDEIQSLNTARALRELGDYTTALGWYRTARHNRTSFTPQPGLDAEIFACAVLTADSLSVFEELLQLVGRRDLQDRGAELELAFRHYAGRRDVSNLGFLRDKLAGRLDQVPPRVRFWYAYTLAAEQEHAEALPVAYALVRGGRALASLEPWQARWIARALPDLLYLNDRRRDAWKLYELLAAADAGVDGRWARYQLGHRFLLSGEYGQAAEIYREACDATEPTDWEHRACALAGTAEQLAAIRKEGERHGTDGIHSR